MVKKIAEKFNRLSRVHQRHRQTTDRQTTYGRLIAYSKRNVVRSLKIAIFRYPSCVSTPPPTEGFPWDDLREIFSECQRMATVPNGVEKLPKISTG